MHCILLHTQTAKHHGCNEFLNSIAGTYYETATFVYISHGSNVEQNALQSCHATMYKFVTSMVLWCLGMQQCAMHNAAIQKTTFFESGVYKYIHHIHTVYHTDSPVYGIYTVYKYKCKHHIHTVSYYTLPFEYSDHYSLKNVLRKSVLHPSVLNQTSQLLFFFKVSFITQNEACFVRHEFCTLHRINIIFKLNQTFKKHM